MINKHHLELLKELKGHTGKGTKHQKERDKNYLGTTKPSYGIKTSIKRQIVKDWTKKHSKLSGPEYIKLLNSLYSGKSYDEISIAGKLLEFLPKLRRQLNPNLLNKWLDKAEGWAEVDSICQSKFSAEEILSNWSAWKNMLVNFSVSANVHKKRASLVLLTRAVRESTDPRLLELSFENIETVKEETNILVTKAISWLLRELTKNHRTQVKKYLEHNRDSLPKVALRETSRKLLTGKK